MPEPGVLFEAHAPRPRASIEAHPLQARGAPVPARPASASRGASPRTSVRWFAALSCVVIVAVGCARATSVPVGYSVAQSAEVDRASERQALTIDGAHRRLRGVVVMVSGAPVTLFTVRVIYVNDDVIEFSIQEHMSPGQCTRALELPTNYRSVRAVELTYRAEPGARPGLARFHVYVKR